MATQQNGSTQVGASSNNSSSGGGGAAGVNYEVYEVIDLANAELDIPPKNCYRLVVLGKHTSAQIEYEIRTALVMIAVRVITSTFIKICQNLFTLIELLAFSIHAKHNAEKLIFCITNLKNFFFHLEDT